MDESGEDDRRRQRADELRARIEELKTAPARPASPREFTDQAASEAAGRSDPGDEDGE